MIDSHDIIETSEEIQAIDAKIKSLRKVAHMVNGVVEIRYQLAHHKELEQHYRSAYGGDDEFSSCSLRIPEEFYETIAWILSSRAEWEIRRLTRARLMAVQDLQHKAMRD